MDQVVQVIGALLILSAYVASQQNKMRSDSVQYLGLNTAGSAILAVLAAVNRDAGFLLLEAVWAWVSAVGLRKALKAQQGGKGPGKTDGRSNRAPARNPKRSNRNRSHLRRVE